MHFIHRRYTYGLGILSILAVVSIFILSGTALGADSGVINVSVANVRSGPGTSYGVTGTVPKNTQIQILQTQGEWDKIQVGSLNGWVNHSLITVSQSAPAPAQTTVSSVAPPRVLLDGQELNFEVAPLIENGRILVPLRAIFEAMGATVRWEADTRTVTASRGDTVVVLPLDSTEPTINGVVYPLDTTAKIVNSRTLAPLRFVGEAFGGTVSWDADSRIVSISTAKNSTVPAAVIVNGSVVNLRSGPSTSYEKVGTVQAGDKLAVVAQKDGWYQVKYGSQPAWIAGWLVKETDPGQGGGQGSTVAGYEVVQEYLETNRPGKDGNAPLSPQGQVVHATADPGATAEEIRSYFNGHPDAKASAHAVIDWTSIIEMIPENEIAWHAGPTANSRFLSFEMCEPADNDPDRVSKFQEVWNRAVWYCAKTCVKYGWNTTDNIFSHNGISLMYHETNHTDPYGYFARYGRTWDQFLSAVDTEIMKLGR